MTEAKPIGRDIEIPTEPAGPSVGAQPARTLEALDSHGKAVPKTSAAEGPPRMGTTIIERQNSRHNRPVAKAEAPSVPEEAPPAKAAWPVVVEPADREAVAAWRNEGDPN